MPCQPPAVPALFAALLTLLVCVSAAAQHDPPSEASAAAEVDEAAGPIVVDPVTGRRYRHERPEEPLRRGALSVDRWVPLAAGAFAVIIAGVVLFLAHRRRSRR